VVPVEFAAEKGDFVFELLDGMVLRGGLIAGIGDGTVDVLEEVVVQSTADGDKPGYFDVVFL
jgi:hypothetical protein